MEFHVHQIKLPVLKPYVQYILFNRCDKKNYQHTIRSFANTNFCLGIILDKQLQKEANGDIFLKDKKGIHSYLTGIYLEPFNFLAKGEQDEICIDFTPFGYYHFFKFPPRTFILNEDILSESFGKEALFFFETVFEEKDIKRRGEIIEIFLLSKFHSYPGNLLCEACSLIMQNKGLISVSAAAKQLNCSEKKFFRLFTNYMDIRPKEYIRVSRFRHALQLINDNRKDFASLSFELGFADQSHLIREVKYFTGITPKNLSYNLNTIQNTVFNIVLQRK